MTGKNPDIVFQDSTTVGGGPEWGPSLDTYEEAPGNLVWMENSIFSIKYAERLANHDQTVHIMYSSVDDDKLPYNSLLTLAEMGVVTAPGSKVPQIYRWDATTWEDKFNSGEAPNVIWTNGEPQFSSFMTDLSTDPQGIGQTPVNEDPNTNTAPPPPGPRPRCIWSGSSPS